MKNQKGQGLVEYLILVCLIAVSAMGIVTLVGTNIKEQYRNISNSLRARKSERLTDPQQTQYQMRGMHDYGDSGAPTQEAQ